MSKQYNKVEKRHRRARYLKRRDEKAKAGTKKSAASPAKAEPAASPAA